MEPTTIYAGGLWRAQSGYGVSTGATREAAIAARNAADEHDHPTPPIPAVSRDRGDVVQAADDPEADGTLTPFQGPERADPTSDHPDQVTEPRVSSSVAAAVRGLIRGKGER